MMSYRREEKKSLSWRWGWVVCCLVAGCEAGEQRPGAVAAGEQFVDAFYAWEQKTLASLMTPGVAADRVLYYQGWAEAANYAVLNRRPCEMQGDLVVCAITVTDDFGQALGYTATDTFSLTITDGMVVDADFEGDDPPVFGALFEWLMDTRPEVFAGPCRDMFEGGLTPGACAQAVAQGARDFAAAAAPGL